MNAASIDEVSLIFEHLPIDALLQASAVCHLWANVGELAVSERQPQLRQPQLNSGSSFKVGEEVEAFFETKRGSLINGSNSTRVSDAKGNWRRGTIVELDATAATALVTALKAASKAASRAAKKAELEALGYSDHESDHDDDTYEDDDEEEDKRLFFKEEARAAFRNTLFERVLRSNLTLSVAAPVRTLQQLRAIDRRVEGAIPVRRLHRSGANAQTLKLARQLHLYHFETVYLRFLQFSFLLCEPTLGSEPAASSGSATSQGGNAASTSAASESGAASGSDAASGSGAGLTLHLPKGEGRLHFQMVICDGRLQICNPSRQAKADGVRPGMYLDRIDGKSVVAPAENSAHLNKLLNKRPLTLVLSPPDKAPKFEWLGMTDGLFNGDDKWFCEMCSCTWDARPEGSGFFTGATTARRLRDGCPVCGDRLFQTCLLKSSPH